MREYEIEEEDCSICMMKMKAATKLCCGHHYHSKCVAKLLENNKKKCPVCNESFDKYYESQLEGNNWFDKILKKCINVFKPRRNIVTEEDIERLQRLFPSIPRGDLESEIAEAGSIDRAILNISEWI